MRKKRWRVTVLRITVSRTLGGSPMRTASARASEIRVGDTVDVFGLGHHWHRVSKIERLVIPAAVLHASIAKQAPGGLPGGVLHFDGKLAIAFFDDDVWQVAS